MPVKKDAKPESMRLKNNALKEGVNETKRRRTVKTLAMKDAKTGKIAASGIAMRDAQTVMTVIATTDAQTAMTVIAMREVLSTMTVTVTVMRGDPSLIAEGQPGLRKRLLQRQQLKRPPLRKQLPRLPQSQPQMLQQQFQHRHFRL